ncbi:MAG TPA: hypothetical protein VMU37_06050 [Caulobacteraceae bacterium]|nr:hypothetical protein [Caulobacteraceae bacterium]
MRRIAIIVGAAVLLAACASGPEGNAWYQQGDANYDALKAAHDACAAKGGTYQVKQGGDPTHLGDYECVGAKSK